MSEDHSFSKKYQFILIALLLAVTIVARLHTDHETDFDSYWLHAQAESIQIFHSALWVFNPASLFGYYPLSYPSGTMFFFAMMSSLTGLNMSVTIQLGSIIIGIIIALCTLALAMSLTKSWVVSYLSALIVSLSPIIISYTAFNAGGRSLIFLFALPFVWACVKLAQTSKWKYVLIAFITVLFAAFTHRTSQFIAIYLLAAICSWIALKLPSWWNTLLQINFVRRWVVQRYGQNLYLLLRDVLVVVFVLGFLKTIDLYRRGRLLTNLNIRVVNSLSHYAGVLSPYALYLLGCLALLIVLMIAWAVYLNRVKHISLRKSTGSALNRAYIEILQNPEMAFAAALFLLALFLFVRQFFGMSFYDPSLQDYYETALFKGHNPLIVFLNMTLNYTTSVTPVFIIAAAGFLFVLFKKNKQFTDWLLIFSTVGFCGILLDKRYVRIFVVPLISILSGIGILALYSWMRSLRKSSLQLMLKYVYSFGLTIFIVLGTFAWAIRADVSDSPGEFNDVTAFWATGQYIKQTNCNCSTVTTLEQSAGVVIFASSGVPGASHNIYYFVNPDKLRPESLSIKTVIDDLIAGNKIESLWILPDWILGGQYYVGKHAIYLFKYPFYDIISRQIVSDYNEKYYIHDKNLPFSNYLVSISPVKNKLYDTPMTTVYSMSTGNQ